MKIKKICIAIMIFSLLTSFVSCAPASPSSESSFEWFDTVTTVSAYMDDDDFNDMWRVIREKFDYYNKLFDIYNEYKGINNLCTVNKNAGKSPVSVDKELIDFMTWARTVYDITDGKVNIAMGSVLSIWHDYRTAGLDDPFNAELPPKELLDEAAKHTNINNLIIDEKNFFI